jgi:hypothetical protein
MLWAFFFRLRVVSSARRVFTGLITTEEDDLLASVAGTATPTPLPAALPLFATGIGALGLLGWRRKRKARAGA